MKLTEIKLESRVRFSPDILFQEVQGDAVLLDMKSGVYFGLDRVGTRMWQIMAEHSVIRDVIAAILTEFDVPEERCREDVLVLVGRLRDQGIVILE
jgi:hypothetical protein